MGTRSFIAAQSGRLQDLSESLSLTADIQAGLSRIRNRVRSIVRNDGFAQSIVSSLKINIVGDRGIALACQAKDLNGSLDVKGNELVNKSWAKWCKYGNCTVEGNMDFVKVQELALETVVTDGECLAIIHRGPDFGVDGFQIEITQIDQLDENYYDTLQNGNIVFQGVELNRFFKPQAYWLWKYNINDPSQRLLADNQRIRVPAKDVIHLYDVTFPKQIRGLSWLVSALLPIHNLNKLHQAEVEMARLATIKQFVYVAQPSESDPVSDMQLEVGAEYINRTAESGVIEIAPLGYKPESLEWSQSQNNNNDNLAKRLLRNAAAGVSVSYNSVAKDLENVNYSSARFGQLEDRSFYATKQRWLINAFIDRVYREWLAYKLASGSLPFGLGKFDKFADDVKYTPRGFSSVDPLKDIKAASESLKWGLSTRSELLAKDGKDFDEVLHAQIQEELKIKAAYEAAGLEPPMRDPTQKITSEAEENNIGEPLETETKPNAGNKNAKSE